MVKTTDPTEKGASPDYTAVATDAIGNGELKMKPTISLFNGVMIITGSIIGSGIFVSPKGVQEKAGSVGLSLVIWVACGLFSAMGAYCYAELGVLIRKSGADYAYIMEAFGSFLGFIRMWIEAIVVRPCSACIVALTFSIYMLRPFFPHCDPPPYTTQLLAAACLILLTAINCYSVKAATRVQDIFTIAKLFALLLIIFTGIVLVCMGRTEYFHNAFEGSKSGVDDIALAFYSGLFAYNGWNYLNFIVEELKNAEKNLPLAIGISMVLVTVIYVTVNVAFYTVVSPDEMLESPAVAVLFANKLYGPMAFTMPLAVAFSTFGSANGVILTSSRLFYAAAREGHMPVVLTMVNKNRLTPMPAVMFTGFLSIMYLFMSDNLYSLMTYVQIVNFLAIGVAILALLWLRYKRPNDPRPIKVFLGFPILFFLGCVFLVVVPIPANPMDTAIGLLLMFSSVPVYLVFVVWKRKPAWFERGVGQFTLVMQKFWMVGPEEKSD